MAWFASILAAGDIDGNGFPGASFGGPRPVSTVHFRRRHNHGIAGLAGRSQQPAMRLDQDPACVPGTPFIYLGVVWRS
jgi:hypothetical protein